MIVAYAEGFDCTPGIRRPVSSIKIVIVGCIISQCESKLDIIDTWKFTDLRDVSADVAQDTVVDAGQIHFIESVEVPCDILRQSCIEGGKVLLI